jgi:hypothetical protein
VALEKVAVELFKVLQDYKPEFMTPNPVRANGKNQLVMAKGKNQLVKLDPLSGMLPHLCIFLCFSPSFLL